MRTLLLLLTSVCAGMVMSHFLGGWAYVAILPVALILTAAFKTVWPRKPA